MQTTVEEKMRITAAKLAEKEIDKISVSDFCKKADVSRASFYIHYKDMDDLIKKTRRYIIDKFGEQLDILFAEMLGTNKRNTCVIFDEYDVSLLKGFSGKDIYWDFVSEASQVLFPKYEKKMIERWGEAYYNEKKGTFEYLFIGSAGILYADLLKNNMKNCGKSMNYIGKISREFLGGI